MEKVMLGNAKIKEISNLENLKVQKTFYVIKSL